MVLNPVLFFCFFNHVTFLFEKEIHHRLCKPNIQRGAAAELKSSV